MAGEFIWVIWLYSGMGICNICLKYYFFAKDPAKISKDASYIHNFLPATWNNKIHLCTIMVEK